LENGTRRVDELACGTGIAIDALANKLHEMTGAADLRIVGISIRERYSNLERIPFDAASKK
jgi:hypothetical protein